MKVGKRLIALTLALMATAIVLIEPAAAAVPKGYTSKVDYENTDTGRYKIDVDLVNQVITVYEKDSAGSYTKIVLQGLCTTGNDENPTGAGTFKLGHLKERFGYFVAFGQYAQYWTQVVRGIYIHSVMYDSKNITTMSKSAYNNLGKALSHGCIRVMPEHAQWIYYNCPPGTTCVISKSRAKNEELVKKLKAEKPSYANYKQPADYKSDPDVIAAQVRTDNTPVRTGFSTTRDKTVVTLNAGDTVSVLQLGPDWCKVQTKKGKLGYVKTQYLSMNPDATVSVHGSYYTKEKTYLYAKPDTGADKLHEYAYGDQVEVVNTVDKYWLTARVGTTYGYVRIKHLQTTAPDLTTSAIAPSEGPNAYIKNGIIANMRSGPGTNYPVVKELTGGTPVKLLEMVGSWYVAEVDGVEG
ncbi:SH3 domain-containing protein, partial [Christensenellaceae bacterium OttesenSCG-928-M15]|nr:SH3 domain-containing protein [Christensenellaceae bacterium OttesenSCG-928-M15]